VNRQFVPAAAIFCVLCLHIPATDSSREPVESLYAVQMPPFLSRG
jgi:hypothetical protein